jgi:hypothetical protein
LLAAREPIDVGDGEMHLMATPLKI